MVINKLIRQNAPKCTDPIVKFRKSWAGGNAPRLSFWVWTTVHSLDRPRPTQGRRQAWARGLNPQKCRLAPNVKHTGQESGGELSDFLNVYRVHGQNL